MLKLEARLFARRESAGHHGTGEHQKPIEGALAQQGVEQPECERPVLVEKVSAQAQEKPAVLEPLSTDRQPLTHRHTGKTTARVRRHDVDLFLVYELHGS